MTLTDPPIPKLQLTFDAEAQVASLAGAPLPLTKTEFRILHFLFDRPDEICSRRQIIDAVQGEDYPSTERSVDVQIASLRKKLGPIGSRIQTVRGKGFYYRAEEIP